MPSRLAPIVLAALVASGCGQTGALRLPADAPARESYLIGGNPNTPPKVATSGDAPADQPAEPVPAVPESAP